MSNDQVGTLFFTFALLHTFLVGFFAKWSQQFKKGSAPQVLIHLLSEVEIVFGFWAVLFLSVWALREGISPVINYQATLNMTEPLFIVCIMVIASTRAVVSTARNLILAISYHLEKIIKLQRTQLQLLVLLIVGPLLGSLITEPAAITITALLLYRMIDQRKMSIHLLYTLTAVLFVNISVGGALTHFAAPPILVVARTWGWSLSDVFLQLGEAALASVVLNTFLMAYMQRREIADSLVPIESDPYPMPHWVVVVHLLFLIVTVATAHQPQIFIAVFVAFLVMTRLTNKYQDQLKYRQAFLVGFFLAGLIVFGAFQKWWLQPLITSMSQVTLFFSAIALTAVTDNAALTYLGSQVQGISELSKWALVGGALVGGGLTILANAPNPAGFSILSAKFPNGTLNAFKLLKAALLPTFVAGVCFFIKIFWL